MSPTWATLSVVTAVLAGLVNTRLVAAAVTQGARAVGLTGADDAIGLVDPAPAHRTVSGRRVALGRVGRPSGSTAPRLLTDLCGRGFVPVVASLGISRDGRLFNVNADTLAGHLAGVLGARRLVIAGSTAGVLDSKRRTIPRLDAAGIRALIASGQAHAGMVAKLLACRRQCGWGWGRSLSRTAAGRAGWAHRPARGSWPPVAPVRRGEPGVARDRDGQLGKGMEANMKWKRI